MGVHYTVPTPVLSQPGFCHGRPLIRSSRYLILGGYLLLVPDCSIALLIASLERHDSHLSPSLQQQPSNLPVTNKAYKELPLLLRLFPVAVYVLDFHSCQHLSLRRGSSFHFYTSVLIAPRREGCAIADIASPILDRFARLYQRVSPSLTLINITTVYRG